MHNLNLTTMKQYDKPKLMDILQNKGPVLLMSGKREKVEGLFQIKETEGRKTKM